MNFFHNMHHPLPHHVPHVAQPITVFPVDPYVVETLKSTIGSYVVFETTRGNIDGCVADVKPDHVVLDTRGQKFFVRICEIVWAMPKSSK